MWGFYYCSPALLRASNIVVVAEKANGRMLTAAEGVSIIIQRVRTTERDFYEIIENPNGYFVKCNRCNGVKEKYSSIA